MATTGDRSERSAGYSPTGAVPLRHRYDRASPAGGPLLHHCATVTGPTIGSVYTFDFENFISLNAAAVQPQRVLAC